MNKDELKIKITQWIITNMNDGDEELERCTLHYWTLRSMENDVHEMIDDILGEDDE